MPEESLYRVEERLDLINRLKTKYGDTIEKILAYCEEKKERLEVLSNYEEYLAQLEKKYAACRKKLDTLAGKLTAIRQEAAERFADMAKKLFWNKIFLKSALNLHLRKLPITRQMARTRSCH